MFKGCLNDGLFIFVRVKKFIILFLTFYCWVFSYSQTQQQWAETVHWDGVSHWSKYIIMMPRYMGPNALPVPAVGNGTIDNNTWAAVSGQFHFAKGDRTQSLVLYGNYCLVKDVISFDISYIPAEWYTMSDTLKRERHVYYEFWNDKKARGDAILNVNIRLLKKWEKKIQLAMRLGYRYPSSNGFGSGRFTDDMGYYLDLSAGKPFGQSGFKWVGMAGFYCWQIDKGDLRQNDAFLFGTGLEYNKNKWTMKAHLAGYLGYMENQGDKPILARFNAEKKFNRASVLMKWQQGLHDFKYSTAELGVKFFFK